MNILQRSTASVNWLVTPAPAADAVWQWEQFGLGRDLYRAGEPLATCLTLEARRGWRTALRDAADAHVGINGSINMISGGVRI